MILLKRHWGPNRPEILDHDWYPEIEQDLGEELAEEFHDYFFGRLGERYLGFPEGTKICWIFSSPGYPFWVLDEEN